MYIYIGNYYDLSVQSVSVLHVEVQTIDWGGWVGEETHGDLSHIFMGGGQNSAQYT